MGLKQDFVRNAYTVWYLLTLRRSFTGNTERIKAEQNRKIYRLMKRAYEIPVYREKFEQSGTTPEDYHSAGDLVKFPTLTKAELRKWMQEEWDEHPEKHDNVSIITTSGSSGNPVNMLYTQKEQACSDANWVRVLRMTGYRPLTGKMYSFAASNRESNVNKRDSIVQMLGLMRRRLVSEGKAVGNGLADIIRDINEYRPDLICLRRNVMVRLVQYANEHGLELYRPKIYAPAGEMIDSITRNVLSRAFGNGLFDAYGVSEMGSFIYGFPGEDRRYVANDIAVANVYNNENELADEGRIIVTSLYKHTYPLINYETGDLAKSFLKDGIRYFTDIVGRMNDLLKHEDGTCSSYAQLMLIINHAPGISQFRIIQESYHDLLLQLVADMFDKSAGKEETEAELTRMFTEAFGDEFRLKFEWLSELPPDKTGKLRCLVCNVE